MPLILLPDMLNTHRSFVCLHVLMQFVDRLSVKAIFNRLDKRKLQNELDIHRLYLVTSHFDRLTAGGYTPFCVKSGICHNLCTCMSIYAGTSLGENYVQDLAAEAQKLGHEVKLHFCSATYLDLKNQIGIDKVFVHAGHEVSCGSSTSQAVSIHKHWTT